MFFKIYGIISKSKLTVIWRIKMKLRHFNVLFLVLALALLCTAKANAFKFPKIPKIPGVGGGLKIPGVDALLKREPVLSTSLADTVPEIPDLDDYDPQTFSPLVEVPRDAKTDFLRYPGLYQFEAQSYCLHAGSYGPRKGNGYLYAPLKGKRAEVIDHILRNSVKHPEVPQRDIQLLIWSILSETKVDKMPDKLQDTAKILLTKKEISSLSSGALDKLPPEVSSQVKAKMPPLARMAFDAENQLRGMLSQQTLPVYSEFERVAVLTGDPPAELRSKNEEDVHSGRWSYHPNGYFIRMFPTSYSHTTVQIYEPENFDIERDDQGRITRIRDPRGNIIETTYADSSIHTNGDNLRGWAFSSVRFVTTGDAAHPGARQEKTWKNTGWTWTGDATGDGNVASQSAPFNDAQTRYQAAQKYCIQMNALNKNLNRNKYQQIAAGSAARINLSNLAHYRAALQQLTATATDAWVIAQVDMVTNAWQSELQAELESSKRTAAAQDTSKVLFPLIGFQRVRALKSFDEGSFAGGGFGGGGAGMPGNPGRQRLAQSSRPAKKGGGPDAIDRAKRATGRMSDANDVVTIATGGLGGYISGWIPGKMFGGILDFIFDNGRKITDALNMDPPRDDVNIYAMPEKMTVPPIAPSATLSAERAQAWNSVMDASVEMLANLRAAHISVDRHGGALQANDAKWIYNQGAAIVHYKKEAGISMITLANRLDELVKISKAEKIKDPAVSTANMRAYQERLRANGFTKEELEAARLIGLTEGDLSQIKKERLAADPQRANGKNMESSITEMSKAIRGLGIHLNSLPPIQLPANANGARQASLLALQG
jgi:hypothetical protein